MRHAFLAAVAIGLAAGTAHAGPGLHVGYGMGPSGGAGDPGLRVGARLGLGFTTDRLGAIVDADQYYVAGGGVLGLRAGLKGRVRIADVHDGWRLHVVIGGGRQWLFENSEQVAGGDDVLVGLAAAAGPTTRVQPLEVGVELLVASLRSPRAHTSAPGRVIDPDGSDRRYAATVVFTLGVRLGPR
jgi:hypothetical protein